MQGKQGPASVCAVAGGETSELLALSSPPSGPAAATRAARCSCLHAGRSTAACGERAAAIQYGMAGSGQQARDATSGQPAAQRAHEAPCGGALKRVMPCGAGPWPECVPLSPGSQQAQQWQGQV